MLLSQFHMYVSILVICPPLSEPGWMLVYHNSFIELQQWFRSRQWWKPPIQTKGPPFDRLGTWPDRDAGAGCSGIGISLKFGPLSALYIANIIDLGLKGDFGKWFFCWHESKIDVSKICYSSKSLMHTVCWWSERFAGIIKTTLLGERNGPYCPRRLFRK